MAYKTKNKYVDKNGDTRTYKEVNLFTVQLSDDIMQKLEWLSKDHLGMTKAKVVRDLIENAFNGAKY